MAKFTLTINDRQQEVKVAADTPLLWVLRDALGLTGTKFGCGIGQCGACMVHIDGIAQASCLIPVSAAVGHAILTIEGLSARGNHPLFQAWTEMQVPQCGYCQPGQIMAAAALLAAHPRPADTQIDAAMDRVLCRCGTYQRIRKAIRRAADIQHSRGPA